ncbi:hypothetical protein ACQPZZ_29045 [Microbispora sp. CA-135349]
MTRRDVQGYAQDLIAQAEAQQSTPPKPPKVPAPKPVRASAKPSRR